MLYFVHESSYIDEDVHIGEDSKIWYFCHIQSGASAKYPKGQSRYKRMLIKHDATLKVNRTIMCGCTIGKFATVAVGAIITEDVKPYALMVGVPAKQIGWVCECGQVPSGNLICTGCKRKYKMENDLINNEGDIVKDIRCVALGV